MDKKTEALHLALEALEANQPVNYCMNNNGEKFPMMQEDPFRFERNSKAITALREALAEQPAQQQEPVKIVSSNDMTDADWDRLFKSPASKPWVGLTYGEVLEQKKDDPIQFYRAIEAKLREKNA